LPVALHIVCVQKSFSMTWINQHQSTTTRSAGDG